MESPSSKPPQTEGYRKYADAAEASKELVDQIVATVAEWSGNPDREPRLNVLTGKPSISLRDWLTQLLAEPMSLLAAQQFVDRMIPTDRAQAFAQANGALAGDHVWKFVMDWADGAAERQRQADACISRAVFGWVAACNQDEYARWCFEARERFQPAHKPARNAHE